MIPLVHDLADETVLIVGGGPVGARRARDLAGGTSVVVVAADFVEGAGFGDAALVRAHIHPADARAWIDRVGPALVIAATDDPALNAALRGAAREAGALANRVDRPDGDVLVPATIRDGQVVVAVSTGGESPALARALRRRIEGAVAGAGAVAEASADLRAEFGERGLPADARRRALRAVVESERVWVAARRGVEAARDAAREVAEERLADEHG